MKKILVPTDFSGCAEHAVDFAVQSAKLFPAEITLFSAFELMGDIYTDYMGINKEFNQSQLREVYSKLADLKKNIEERDGVVVDTSVFTGSVKEGILQAGVEKNIGLVIMGTAGATGIKEKLWGSKTADIIGKSLVPVLAIPSGYSWKKPGKILLATNHFEKDREMLDFIFELADLYKAQVQVVVFTDEEKDETITLLEHSRRVPEYEKILKDQYKTATLTVTNLFGSAFEETLQDYISKNEIDILAMITYKRSFPDSLFHPSMTKRMAYHTKIPLLAIPAKHE